MCTHVTNTYCNSLPVAAYLCLCSCPYFPEDISSEPSNCCSYTCRHFNATIYHCTTALWLFSLVLQSLTLTQTHRLHAYTVGCAHRHTQNTVKTWLSPSAHTQTRIHTDVLKSFGLAKPVNESNETKARLNLISTFAFDVSNLWIYPASVFSWCVYVFAHKRTRARERGGKRRRTEREE